MSATTATWKEWLSRFQTGAGPDRDAADLLDLPELVARQEWKPSDDDRTAAWDLYTELRTRITVQPLHYLHGDEETALQSVADLFKMARKMMRKAGPRARHFATLTAFALNRVIRPFTAKWHKRKCEGKLANEDTRHKLRDELIELQKQLRVFATLLGALAEGADFCGGSESWPEAEPAANRVTAPIDQPIPFDIAFDEFVDAKTAAKIRWDEHSELCRRRGMSPWPLPAVAANATTAQIVRAHRLPDSPLLRLEDVSGLALSGGGIRSATFALGVVQRLVEAGVAERFDYLSTVSGGGYLGSFLSTYLNTDSADVALVADKLPFREPDVGESAPMRHLRGHSKYLIKGGLLNRMNMALLGAFGVVSTVLIFWPLLAFALLAVEAAQGDTVRGVVRDGSFSIKSFLLQLHVWGPPAILCVLPLLSLAPAALICRHYRKERGLLCYQGIIAWVVLAGLVVLAWDLVPLLFRGVHALSRAKGTSWLPSATAITGAIAALQRLWAGLDSAPASSKVKRVVSMLIMALVGPAFAILLFLLLGQEWIVKQPVLGSYAVNRFCFLGALAVVPFVFCLSCLDINLSSLHPFYRRKLSEAYLIAYQPSDKDAGAVTPQDGLKLSELRGENSRAPYHLINCALEAPSSDDAAVRGRGTDFFFFSQKYSGSAATGYFETKEWEHEDSRLNLGTAMAVSAAAASPFMGVASIPGGNFLLTLFNIRLDYWLAVPRRRKLPWWLWRAGPWYLLRQGFGWMDDKSWFVDVSDGGHIENLALYELLRRRCKFIVAVDGECDPEIHCGSLMRLVRYAEIDFGIEIKIDMSRLKRGGDGNVPFHFALATLKYPELNGYPKATGYLIYVKLSVTGNEPPDVADYRTRHPEFPHESTADQFFEEDQFESYRALGYHAAADLFSRELLGDKTEPASLAEWFGGILKALEDPNKT